ncbi:MAG: CHAD domain-containing protein [Phycisphaeraceae bacterium]|nr:CHAD domain-containing protein [Phycisphaeraceae bacterium]MCW5761667.1 CHAD domain-containing protein [Phycisphaeraceae bacterium]
MPFCLVDPHDQERDLRRLFIEQIDRAQSALTASKLRTFRTSCKRARATLHCCGDLRHDKSLRTMDRKIRSLSHTIAPARDHEAIASTARSLARISPPSDLDSLMRALARATAPPAAPTTLTSDLRRTLRDELGQLRTPAADLSPTTDDFWLGIQREYRKARQRMPTTDSPSPESLHRWRLAAKKHWYHLRLCRTIHPRLLQTMAQELRAITQALGSCNDLTILLTLLDTLQRPDAAHLASLARAEHAHQLHTARSRARSAFAPKPSHLVDFLRDLHRSWTRSA